MIKGKTPENIEERKKQKTPDKFIPNSCFWESGRIIETWIENFVHQQGPVFNKTSIINYRWYMYP